MSKCLNTYGLVSHCSALRAKEARLQNLRDAIHKLQEDVQKEEVAIEDLKLDLGDHVRAVNRPVVVMLDEGEMCAYIPELPTTVERRPAQVVFIPPDWVKVPNAA